MQTIETIQREQELFTINLERQTEKDLMQEIRLDMFLLQF